MVIADIPGLIEGAATGKGLGHQFLRHVERARVLLVLVDLAEVENRTPKIQEEILIRELTEYDPDLLNRPRAVVGTKSDVATLTWSGPTISSVTGQGIDTLVGRLRQLVEEARNSDPEPVQYVMHRPGPEGAQLNRHDNGTCEGLGRQALRAVALSDLTDIDAMNHAQERLEQLRVSRALARAGAVEGDVVMIGTFQFEYEPDS